MVLEICHCTVQLTLCFAILHTATPIKIGASTVGLICGYVLLSIDISYQTFPVWAEGFPIPTINTIHSCDPMCQIKKISSSFYPRCNAPNGPVRVCRMMALCNTKSEDCARLLSNQCCSEKIVSLFYNKPVAITQRSWVVWISTAETGIPLIQI